MHWIRQAPGKGLEWIIYYYSDSYKSSAQSVQGRFTVTKDSSNFYLHMNQLKTEDTAVYYCARDTVGVSGQSLTYSDSVVKRPGESVTLSCGVSGISMGSYYSWIRQKPGRGLEWIGRIDGGTGTSFAQSLQGQFSITKDTSKNMLYLEVKSLKTEDTAVYYCARDAQ
ncbi:hypothetical protein PO909_001506 [Leuciscus waleckii]